MDSQQIILYSADGPRPVLVKQINDTFRIVQSLNQISEVPTSTLESSNVITPGDGKATHTSTMTDKNINVSRHFQTSGMAVSKASTSFSSCSQDVISYTPGILFKKNQTDGTMTALAGTLVASAASGKMANVSVVASEKSELDETSTSRRSMIAKQIIPSSVMEMVARDGYYTVTADTGTVQGTETNYNKMSIPLQSRPGSQDQHALRHDSFKQASGGFESDKGVENPVFSSSSCRQSESSTIDLTQDNDSSSETDTEKSDYDQVRPMLLFTHEAASKLSGRYVEENQDWASMKYQRAVLSDDQIEITKISGIPVMKVGVDKKYDKTKAVMLKPISHRQFKLPKYSRIPPVTVSEGVSDNLGCLPSIAGSALALSKGASVHDGKPRIRVIHPATTTNITKPKSIPIIFAYQSRTLPKSSSVMNPTNILSSRDDVINFLSAHQPNITTTPLGTTLFPPLQSESTTAVVDSSVMRTLQPQMAVGVFSTVSKMPAQNANPGVIPARSEMPSLQMPIVAPVSLQNVNYSVTPSVMSSDKTTIPQSNVPLLSLGMTAPSTLVMSSPIQQSMPYTSAFSVEPQPLTNINAPPNTQQQSVFQLCNSGNTKSLVQNSLFSNIPDKQHVLQYSADCNNREQVHGTISSCMANGLQQSLHCMTPNTATCTVLDQNIPVTTAAQSVLPGIQTLGSVLNCQTAMENHSSKKPTYIMASGGTNPVYPVLRDSASQLTAKTVASLTSNPIPSIRNIPVSPNVQKPLPYNMVGVAQTKTSNLQKCVPSNLLGVSQATIPQISALSNVPKQEPSNLVGVVQAQTIVIPAPSNVCEQVPFNFVGVSRVKTPDLPALSNVRKPVPFSIGGNARMQTIVIPTQSSVRESVPCNRVGVAEAKTQIIATLSNNINQVPSYHLGVAHAKQSVVPTAQYVKPVPSYRVGVTRAKKSVIPTTSDIIKSVPPDLVRIIQDKTPTSLNMKGIPSNLLGVAQSQTTNAVYNDSNRYTISTGIRMPVYLVPFDEKLNKMCLLRMNRKMHSKRASRKKVPLNDNSPSLNPQISHCISSKQPVVKTENASLVAFSTPSVSMPSSAITSLVASNLHSPTVTSINSASNGELSSDAGSHLTPRFEGTEPNYKMLLEMKNDLEREKYLLEHCRKIERGDSGENSTMRPWPKQLLNIGPTEEKNRVDFFSDVQISETESQPTEEQLMERKEPLILKRKRRSSQGESASACLVAAARSFMTSTNINETNDYLGCTTAPRLINKNDVQKTIATSEVGSSSDCTKPFFSTANEVPTIDIRIGSVFSLTHEDEEIKPETVTNVFSLQTKNPKKKKRNGNVDLSYIRKRRKRKEQRDVYSKPVYSSDRQTNRKPILQADVIDMQSQCRPCSVALHELDIGTTMRCVGEIDEFSSQCSQLCRQKSVLRMLIKNRTKRSFETALRECFADKKPRYEIFDPKTLLVTEEELFGCRRSRRIKTVIRSRENSPIVASATTMSANFCKRPKGYNTKDSLSCTDGQAKGVKIHLKLDTNSKSKLNRSEPFEPTPKKPVLRRVDKKQKHKEMLSTSLKKYNEKQTNESTSPLALTESIVSAKTLCRSNNENNIGDTKSVPMEFNDERFSELPLDKVENGADTRVVGDRDKKCVVFQVGDNNFIVPVTTGINATHPRACFVGFDSTPTGIASKTCVTSNSDTATCAKIMSNFGKQTNKSSGIEFCDQIDTKAFAGAKCKTEPEDTHVKPVILDDNHGDHEEKIRRLKEMLQEKKRVIKELKIQKDSCFC